MDFAAVVRAGAWSGPTSRAGACRTPCWTASCRTRSHAPSAGFSQGWDFVVLDTPDDLARFWAATTDPEEEADAWLRGMRSAPVLVVCLSDRDRYLARYAEPDKGWTDRDEARWPVPYWDVDTGWRRCSCSSPRWTPGLGACFFGVPPERQAAVLEALDAPENRRIVGVVSVGHAAPDRRSPSLRRGRRRVDEIAHDGRFGVPWRLRGRG